MKPRALASAVLLVLICGIAIAATIVAPRNLAVLLHASDLAVLAQAQGERTEARGGLVRTIVAFRIERVVSGRAQAGDEIEVEVLGGESEVDGLGWDVPGAPKFLAGRSYLLFLAETGRGTLRPVALSYGALERVAGVRGTDLLSPLDEARVIETVSLPGAANPETIGTYRAEPLMDHLAQIACGAARWDSASVLASAEDLPARAGGLAERIPDLCKVTQYTDGLLMRWFEFDSGHSVSMSALPAGDASLPGGGFAELQTSLSNWENVSRTSVNVLYGGTTAYVPNCAPGASHTPFPPNNVVLFGDPCADLNDLTGCVAGVLAVGGKVYQISPEPFQGSSWHRIVGWYIVVARGTGCLGSANYVRMLTHELGHGLGFDHTDDPNSVMQPFCCNDIGSTDVVCLQSLYPPEVSSVPSPEISVSTTAPRPGDRVFFTTSSAGGTATSWTWDFGDGSTSTEQNPSHVYASEGAYRVTLTAANSAGSKPVFRSVLVVGNRGAPRLVPHPPRAPRSITRGS